MSRKITSSRYPLKSLVYVCFLSHNARLRFVPVTADHTALAVEARSVSDRSDTLVMGYSTAR
jgi:hypothetical protein